MNSPNELTVALNEDQLQVLRTVYAKRTRLFVLGFFGVLALWLRASIDFFGIWYKVHYVYSKKQFYAEVVDKVDWGFIASLVFLTGLLVYFGSILTKRIIPLHKDIKYRSGAYIDMKIIRKSIPYHNRCFFFFDDLKIPYKEVDHKVYYTYQPGDTIKVLTGRHSKMHIDEYLNIPVI